MWLTGTPCAKRLSSRKVLGWLRPKQPILGVDIVGEVESVGEGVTRYEAGDEVYANLLDHGYGGFAGYAAVPSGVVAPKPANLSHEQAVAVPMAGVTALQDFDTMGTSTRQTWS
jgi:NADPH:quinone reductase-like Zn-dependent oxidoreductase